MKNTILISSILLAAAGCSAETTELHEIQEEAITSRSELVEQVFLSKDSFKYRVYEWVPSTGESVARDLDVKVRLTFIGATKRGGYSLDGKSIEADLPANDLDYEVIVERVDVATNKVHGDDTTYFARKTGKNKHELFDCDSTRRCETDSQRARMYAYTDSQGRKGLKLKNEAFSLIATNKSEIEFIGVPGAAKK